MQTTLYEIKTKKRQGFYSNTGATLQVNAFKFEDFKLVRRVESHKT